MNNSGLVETINQYKKNISQSIKGYKESIKEYAGSITLIGYGALNTIHGGMHVVQAMQSFYLASHSVVEHAHGEHSEGLMHVIEESMHNPYAGLFFGATGVLAIYLGIRDRKHHKKIHEDLKKKDEQLKTKDERINELESMLQLKTGDN